jgi:hypothetical protein
MRQVMSYVVHLPSATEARGWKYARLKFVCSDCVNDPALKLIIRKHATRTSCSFCNAGSNTYPISAHLNILLRHIYDSIREEWWDEKHPPKVGKDGRPMDSVNDSRRRTPESPHDILCEMQRSHGERIYSHRARHGRRPRTLCIRKQS